MAKSVIDKIAEVLVGPARPAGTPQYGDVVVPWHRRLWQSIRPPDKIPRRRKPLSTAQRRMLVGTLAVAALGAASWSAYAYFTTVQERSMALVSEGMRLLGPNNLRGEHEKFTAAIGTWPDNARAYLERGNVNRMLGDTAGATEDWSRAIELDGRLTDAYTARGTMYRVEGQWDRALADLDRAIAVSPTMDAYYQRGQVYHQQGNYAQAMEDFDRSIDQKPDAPYVYRARAVTRLRLGDELGAQSDETTADRLERVR
jgi:tetratricopeptide (TPR) repeat protein